MYEILTLSEPITSDSDMDYDKLDKIPHFVDLILMCRQGNIDMATLTTNIKTIYE